jgi:hypothetical protein
LDEGIYNIYMTIEQMGRLRDLKEVFCIDGAIPVKRLFKVFQSVEYRGKFATR